jgi:hypothetical protein
MRERNIVPQNYRETLPERSARINRDGAALRREFRRRLEILEKEHVMRLIALFQEFNGRADAIRKGKTQAEVPESDRPIGEP